MSPLETSSDQPQERPRRKIALLLRLALWLILGGVVGAIIFNVNQDARDKVQDVASRVSDWLEDPNVEKQARESLQAAGALVILNDGRAATVNLRGMHVTDEVAQNVGRLSHVVALDLSSTDIQDGQLHELNKLRDLASLVLSRTPVTDEGMLTLKHLDRLDAIYLVETKVTDRTLEHMKSMSRAKAIDLSGAAAITDDGIGYIASLPDLQWLLIAKNEKITDASVEHLLKQRGKLKRITLNGTKISDEGKAALRKGIAGVTLD